MANLDSSSSTNETLSSPIRSEEEKREIAIRELYQNEKGYYQANTPSNVTRGDLRNLKEKYQIPDQYDLRVPRSNEKMYFRVDKKYVAVHTQALKYGLRFPLHDFVNAFFTFTGISLSQLAPNSFIYLIAFIAFCHSQKVTPAIDFFFSLFSLSKTREPGFRCLSKLPGKKTLIQTPTTNKGWHPGWFFIYGTDMIQIPSWGEPQKVNLGFDKLAEVRLKEFNDFCDKMPSEPWDLELLSNNQWLHDHGCKYFFHLPFNALL